MYLPYFVGIKTPEKSIKLCGMALLGFFCVWLLLHQDFAIAKDVTWVPRNKKELQEISKDMNCSKGLVAMVALLNNQCKTGLVCAKDKRIHDKACLEYNGGQVQARYTATCENFSITPCTSPYMASKSYELFECFEIYGCVPSPQQVQEELASCKIWKIAGIIVITILSIVSISVTIIFIYIFCAKKCSLKETTEKQKLKITQSRNDGLETTGPEGEHLIQNTEQQNNDQEHNSIKGQAPEFHTGQEKSGTYPRDIDIRHSKKNSNSGSLVVYYT